MHSALTRLQNVFGFFTTVAFFVGALTALSVFLHPGRPSAEVSVSNVQVVRGRPHYYSTTKQEYAHVKFDLDADFSSLFTWNTKQLFVYVLASYPTTYPSPSPSSPISLSESLVWDIIIPAPPTTFSYSALVDKYFSKGPKSILSSKSSSKSKSKSSSKSKLKSSNDSSSKTKKPGILKLKNQKPKYQITDVSGKMAELGNATLVVGWNVQPWVGALQWDGWSLGSGWAEGKGGRSGAFEFPALKGVKKTETGKEQGTAATGGGVGV